MKYFVAIFTTFILLNCAANAQTLTVHEWGTFTTLHGSTGNTLSGLYFEEEQLPNFVYHFPGFSPDPAIATNGYIPCKDVTVKMETPVLYFYSTVERPVQVHVDFPMGAISQWYPNRSGGEVMPTGSSVNFDDRERNGSIDWKATVLALNTTETLTQTQNIPVKWDAPRQTNSNLVKNDQGEVEKYLFYRGLANFSLPVSVSFKNEGLLKITNSSNLDIPYIYVYDHSDMDSASVWASGPLAAGETKIISRATKYYREDNLIPEYYDFLTALKIAGLNQSEALALLHTWDEGYFQTTGFKIFWIVPRSMTDAILPITIIPKPDELQRVLVAKTEILTPDFEKQLVSYYTAHGNLDDWKGDRYQLAYMQRVDELLGINAVKENDPSGGISLAPNPASSSLHIRGASGNLSVTIRNILGETVMSLSENMTKISEFDIHTFRSGIYFVTITDGVHRQTLKLVKR